MSAEKPPLPGMTDIIMMHMAGELPAIVDLEDYDIRGGETPIFEETVRRRCDSPGIIVTPRMSQ